MGKKAELEIKEGIKELESLRVKQKTLGRQKRVLALIRILRLEDNTRQDLANYLGVHIRTLERWLATYKRKGIAALLEVKPRRKGSNIISQQLHEALALRVNDPENSFLGYWDVQRWVESEYGIKPQYNTLRQYLIRHFGTKIKSSRKSHMKKDEQAVAFFKNAEG